MRNFVFNIPTKIFFGKDIENQIGKEASIYGKKVLLHFGGGSIKKMGLYDKVVASLKGAGLEIFELSGVEPNPRLSLVREGIKLVRENGINLILAVGGGSVIDSAKAIGVGALYDGDVWDFYEYKCAPQKCLPIGTVLTIAAAGSESSPSTVITNTDLMLKRGLTNDVMYPKFSFLNPENTFTLPKYQIGCGVSDILAHMMERYFVNTKNVDVTDRMIEGVIRSVLEFAPKAIENPTDYDIRAEIMWAGTMAHNGVLDTGRGGDWASHGIEHELSAIYDIAHGAGLSIVFPAWMKKVRQTNPFKLVQFGKRVFDLTGSDDEIIDSAIAKLEEFYKSIGMPVRLSEVSITEKHFEEMAHKAISAGGGNSMGSYVPLSERDVTEIYKLAK